MKGPLGELERRRDIRFCGEVQVCVQNTQVIAALVVGGWGCGRGEGWGPEEGADGSGGGWSVVHLGEECITM